MRLRRLLAMTATVFAATAVTAAAQPTIMMYGTPETNRKVVQPGASDALPVDGRLLVSGRTKGHLFAGEADKPYRVDHLLAGDLVKLPDGESMAALLKSRIDENACLFSWGRVDCRSGLVFVDEIDWRFAEKAPNLNTAAWRGRTSKGQPKRKFPTYHPTARAGQAGYELSRAMQILAETPYRSGGTYAERVHFFIAPGVVTSIGVGRGPYHNLGRDGRPHFRSHEGVRAALQLSGGIWLEMYHYDHGGRGKYPFNTYEWQVYPNRFALYLSGRGSSTIDTGLRAKMHFLVSSGKPKVKGGAPAQCRTGSAMTCTFKLASSGKNMPILMNGVGQYRIDADAAEFRANIKRLFFPELP